VVAVTEVAPGELVERGRLGDPAALGALYDLLAADVQRCLVALRIGLSPVEVEDALQETFLRLFRGLDRLDPARSPKAWALGIARHVAHDMARRRRVRRAEEGDPDRRAGEGRTSDAVARGEESALVREALDALPDAEREVLALRHQSRLTMEALAGALRCSVPTARGRLRAAASRFAAELRARGVLPAGAEGGAA
jgi:RNA polymerase sigma-70 factor (ECF subfamily)